MLILYVVTSTFTILISKRMAATRKRWTDHTQDRIADTSNILAQFKDVKMMGLAPSMARRLQKKQVQETKLVLADRRMVISTFSVCMQPCFFPVVASSNASQRPLPRPSRPFSLLLDKSSGQEPPSPSPPVVSSVHLPSSRLFLSRLPRF